MPAISPADGPVAVTGASGYIGSWAVRDCVEQGYVVHACVRNKADPGKVDHLLALNRLGRGRVELFEADLGRPGSYDAPFRGCAGVLHVGAVMGRPGAGKETPQEVYDGSFTNVAHVLESARGAGSVKRFVYTSSFAAVGHPRPAGYVFTERDWCGDNLEAYRGYWTKDMVPKDRNIAYAMAKAESERMAYRLAEDDGRFEAVSINPCIVLGPLMARNHDDLLSWQNCLRMMMQGEPLKRAGAGGRMLWNIVDVRDVARAHRRCLEVADLPTGSRFILSACDRSGELLTWQVQALLRRMYPGAQVGGEEMDGAKPAKRTFDGPRSYCLLAREVLGLQSHSAEDTLRATVDSYMRIGLLGPAVPKL
mmetsp:Transcript_89830/g.254545  ORF Transcript_89830/g.254545 Transcript_89830/m.254545 type:complete len:365 (-) Transcript_89830:119-1213(-)